MRRRRREALILKTLAGMPNRQGYPSEIAQASGLEPYRTHRDLVRMAHRRRGVVKIAGQTRYCFD